MNARSEMNAMRLPLRMGKLFDKNVVNLQNDKLGQVKDMIIDPEGCISYLLVGYGGTLGIGEKMVPVPWDAIRLQHSGEDMSILLDVPKDRFEGAPYFLDREWSSYASTGWEERIRKYYGEASRRVKEEPAEPGKFPTPTNLRTLD